MRARIIIAACAVASLVVPATALAGPSAQTAAATDVTATSATLHAVVNPDDKPTTYWFELGTTTAYGTATAPTSMAKGKKPVDVTSAAAGLQSSSLYHARVVAQIDKTVIKGADVTFTTADAPPDPGAPAPLPVAALPAPPASTPSLASAAKPELGHSVTVAAGAGAVVVRLPGAARAVVLQGPASIPVGSMVDTRRGAVDLTSELPGGSTQTGSFHGGVFEVRQPVGGHGLVELALRGKLPTCPAGGARAAAAVTKRPPRRLWGHDNHGRFRTRASNAVITVRGTTWYVADRCDGTLTRVTRGSVAVRDLRRHRTVVVRAGHRYLAKRR
jgi:hypothetical protein